MSHKRTTNGAKHNKIKQELLLQHVEVNKENFWTSDSGQYYVVKLQENSN